MSKLDKIFKHKLEHYNAEFPTDAWDKIEARLPNPKKSNRLFWPILSLCLVLITAGVGSFYINQASDSKNQKAQNVQGSIVAVAHENLIHHRFNVQNSISSQQDQLGTATNYNDDSKANLATQVATSTDNQNPDIAQKSDLNLTEMVPFVEKQRNNLKIVSIQSLTLEKLSSSNSKRLKFVTAFGSKEPTSKACPFVIEGRDKSLDIYYSSDFINKSLSGPESFDSHKSIRMATELPMYSFSAGFRFGYNLSYRWNLHTGVNYSQINEKFKYIDPESNSTRVITIKDYIYENGRIVDSIVKEETIVVPGTTIHTVYNKFRTIDIPILARYTLMANRYMSLSAVSGIYINVATFQKGMILNPLDQKPMDILQENADGNSMYKTNIGISLFGGLSLAYHLGAHTDLLLEPHFRWQTETMTHQSYPLDQKINAFSLSTGLRYKF
jgi:hypothetical protein